ncbi:ribosome maturation factor RimP [Pseudomonadota bacterium]|nr:ribosome maturation factor RimP [Pseudomonadota bacterium]
MIENNIRELLFTRLKNLGYHLIRIKIINASGKKTLQIMAERIKDREMNIKDCTFLSRQISSYLEVDDPISSAYTLEVSSGGLSRPLTILDDYKWFKGSKAKITLKEIFMGKKSHNGFLQGLDKDNLIILKTEDFEMKINFLEIDKANIDMNWAIENNKIN